MNWGKWKIPIIGWAALAGSVWALLYGLYWHDRTENRIFWGDAVIDWIGDFVMLRWVDTTLGAGFLAFAGGAFVYFAARRQRSDQIQDRVDALRSTRIDQLTELRRLFVLLADAAVQVPVSSIGSFTVPSALLQQIRENASALKIIIAGMGAFSPILTRGVGSVASRIDLAAQYAAAITAGPEQSRQLRERLVDVFSVLQFFTNVDRLVAPDGTYQHRPVPLVNETVEDLPVAIRAFFKP